jgi:hypothetical protein
MSNPDAGFKNLFPFTFHRDCPSDDRARGAFLPEVEVTARFCKKEFPYTSMIRLGALDALARTWAIRLATLFSTMFPMNVSVRGATMLRESQSASMHVFEEKLLFSLE